MLVFWVETPCGLAGRYQSFGLNMRLFIQIVGIHLQATTLKTNIDIFIVVRTSDVIYFVVVVVVYLTTLFQHLRLYSVDF
jgi:hypothetical protein